MIVGPVTRIIVRYGIGVIFGAATATMILDDPDLMTFAAMGVSFIGTWAIERIYIIAKRRGWPM